MLFSLSHRAALAAVGAGAAIAIAPSTLCGQEDASRTLVYDPVRLIAGEQSEGREDLFIEHEGIRYRFVNDDNRAAFIADPARYSVADGGACGRMGPLSGLGDARRFAVHDGRIYFFASEGCRSGFLSDPARHIELDDPLPAAPVDQPERAAEGREIIARCLNWAGDLDVVQSCRLSVLRTQPGKDATGSEVTWNISDTWAFSFPAGHPESNAYHHRNAWNEFWYTTNSSGGRAVSIAEGSFDLMAASRSHAFVRSMHRHPIVILKSVSDPDFMAVADGSGEVDGVAVDYVKVACHGATNRLAVEKGTGRLVSQAFHARENSMTVGDVVRTFTAYSAVKGVTLPTAWTTSFDGVEQPTKSISGITIEINPELPDDTFRTSAP